MIHFVQGIKFFLRNDIEIIVSPQVCTYPDVAESSVKVAAIKLPALLILIFEHGRVAVVLLIK